MTEADWIIVFALCKGFSSDPVGPNAWMCRLAWWTFVAGQPFDTDAAIAEHADWLNRPDPTKPKPKPDPTSSRASSSSARPPRSHAPNGNCPKTSTQQSGSPMSTQPIGLSRTANRDHLRDADTLLTRRLDDALKRLWRLTTISTMRIDGSASANWSRRKQHSRPRAGPLTATECATKPRRELPSAIDRRREMTKSWRHHEHDQKINRRPQENRQL